MKRIFTDARSILFFVFILNSATASAVNEWFEFYNNSRTLAMGGASIAITSDDTSLYRNPANLGSMRDVYGSLFDPEIEGTSNLTASQADVTAVLGALTGKTDTYYRSKMQISPTIVGRNIGFGLIYKNEISAEIKSSDPTVMDTRYQNDAGVALGLNLRLFDGRVKIGATGRLFNRIEVNNPALSVSGPTDLKSIAAEGSALALDAGLLLQAPWTYIPTIGVVVRDIGNTKFNDGGQRLTSSLRPAEVKQSLDAALAIFPIHSNRFRSVWTIEYSDLTNSRNDTDNAKRAHLGIEFNSRDIFFFRMGYNQRYLTAGFEIASEYLIWQVTSYGEEVGTKDDPREDRRLNMKVAVKF
jgi:hypothetical protein